MSNPVLPVTFHAEHDVLKKVEKWIGTRDISKKKAYNEALQVWVAYNTDEEIKQLIDTFLQRTGGELIAQD